MNYEKEFNIYTDASFDHITKIGTYAIVIIQEKKIIKAYGKKCDIQMKNSTECEIYAIFQTLKLIESNLIKKDISQKFYISTDCSLAIDIFEKNNNSSIFKNNIELLNNMKKSYERIKNNPNNIFKMQWISRKANKIAHKYSYSTFSKIKTKEEQKHITLSEIKTFLNLLKSQKEKQYRIIAYLFQNSNSEKLILKTQNEISKTLNIPLYYINKIFQEFVQLKVIKKISNGKYMLLI